MTFAKRSGKINIAVKKTVLTAGDMRVWRNWQTR